MGSTELQVFIALGVVLAAVLIALAVDFLKGSNERLREHNAALVEREKAAEQRASQVERLHHQMIELVEALKDAEQMRPVAVSEPMVRPRVSLAPEPGVEQSGSDVQAFPDAKLVVQTPTPLPDSPVAVRVVRNEEDLVHSDQVIEELPPMAELVSAPVSFTTPHARKTRRFVGEPVKALPVPAAESEPPVVKLSLEAPVWEQYFAAVPEVDEPAEAQAVEGTPAVVEPVITEPIIAEPVHDLPPAPEPAVEIAFVVEPVEARQIEAPEEAQQPVHAETVQPEEPPAPAFSEPPKPVESKVVEMPRPAHAPVDPDARLMVPGGIRPPEVLTDLLRQEVTFLGVSLSISVVDYVRLVAEHGKEAVEQVMGALEGLVQSSGVAGDLVCRISEDEFIVVCPGATGAAATSRVQQLSENLWDFQLRSLVSFPILFSWGASECGLMPGMPRLLADSIDRSREQMLETRRSRRALTWASAKYGLQSSAG